MEIDPRNIGIIAGAGQFPLLFIEAARSAGRRVFVIAHKNETSEAVADAADAVCWVKLGQLGKMIKFFKDQAVGETVFLGAITKTRIFRDVLPDFRCIALWNTINTKQDDAILRAVAGALESDGIKVLESTLYLRHLLFPKGVLTRKKPNKEQRTDIVFGWRHARAIGSLDIGQCVVVRNLSVAAVEAIEGTDAAIIRGGGLVKEKAVVVKVKKPGQDFRFDLPATGLTTIESLKSVQASVLAVEAGQSLIFDRQKMVEAADKAGIVIVGVEELEDGSLDF
ncbi:MAG: UDP-2,3-diacylglucosamine diphosphatase LpxI [Desulfocapsaceae bacterium]|nr:UDP-2,3-diacylglucosamine diphosphatase LpxI [Desulfocapsaceae bacterium]